MVVALGESLHLTCFSDSAYSKWFFRNPNFKKEIQFVGFRNELNIDPVSYDNMGLYICFGTNENGEHFLDEIQVLVYGKYSFQNN